MRLSNRLASERADRICICRDIWRFSMVKPSPLWLSMSISDGMVYPFWLLAQLIGRWWSFIKDFFFFVVDVFCSERGEVSLCVVSADKMIELLEELDVTSVSHSLIKREKALTGRRVIDFELFVDWCKSSSSSSSISSSLIFDDCFHSPSTVMDATFSLDFCVNFVADVQGKEKVSAAEWCDWDDDVARGVTECFSKWFSIWTALLAVLLVVVLKERESKKSWQASGRPLSDRPL